MRRTLPPVDGTVLAGKEITQITKKSTPESSMIEQLETDKPQVSGIEITINVEATIMAQKKNLLGVSQVLRNTRSLHLTTYIIFMTKFLTVFCFQHLSGSLNTSNPSTQAWLSPSYL